MRKTRIVSFHKWWHNQNLREAHAVAEGWRTFTEVYNPSARDLVTMREKQRERLTHALQRASRTKYYAGILGGRQITPDTAMAVHDSLPLLTKSAFRASTGDFLTGLVEESDELRVRTSGTTGEPLVITHDDSLLTETVAANMRMLDAYGLEPGFRLIRLTSSPRQALVSFSSLASHGGAVVLQLNVSRIGAGEADFVNQLCREFRPDAVWGQPMEVLTAVLRQREQVLRLPALRLVFTHGDTLDPRTRDVITETFDAPHRDIYGLQEFGRVAWECPDAAGTYHIEEERVVVDTDEHGHLLISSLANKAMSLLRYQPGDAGQVLREACPCGRPQARLTGLEGRQRGLVVDRHGQPVSVKPLRLELEAAPLDRWQVIQEEPGRIHVRIAPVRTEDGERLAEQLTSSLGDAVDLAQVTVEPVALADLASASGKAPHFRLLATQHAFSRSTETGNPPW